MTKPQKYKDVVKVLRGNGWELLRQGKGSHEKWGLPGTDVTEIIARHDEVSAGIIGKLIKKLNEYPQSWK